MKLLPTPSKPSGYEATSSQTLTTAALTEQDLGQYTSRVKEVFNAVQGGGDWSQEKDTRQLMILMAMDEEFRDFLHCNTNFRIKNSTAILINGTSDKQTQLSALLAKPTPPSGVQLTDFEALIRGELVTNAEKWVQKLTDAFQQQSQQMERIRQKLRVVDEYQRNKYHNPISYNPLVLDQQWLQMKDLILVPADEPLPDGVNDEAAVLRVPTECQVTLLISNAQTAIKILEQNVKTVWTHEQQDCVSDYLADRMNVVIQKSGAALAEAMTTLICATVKENPEELYAVHEEAILRVKACDALDIVGPGNELSLLGESARAEMTTFELGNPSEEARSDKMIDLLSRQLRESTQKQRRLAIKLKEATQKALKVYQKERTSALLKSAETLLHAHEASHKLRETLLREGDSTLKAQLKDLLPALEHSEGRLRQTLCKLAELQPGVKKNLQIGGRLIKEWWQDSSWCNGSWKTWDNVKEVASAIVQGTKSVDAKIGGGFHRLTAKNLIEQEKLSDLSTLLMPLDSAADLVTSFVDPLLISAARLKRVVSKDLKSRLTEKEWVKEDFTKHQVPSNAHANSEMLLERLLDAELGERSKVKRRLAKKEQFKQEVAVQLAEIRKVLPHIREQLAVGFEKKGAELETKHSGYHYAWKYLGEVKMLRDKYQAEFTHLEERLSKAENQAGKDWGKETEELHDIAKTMARLGKNLSRHIRSICEKELGTKFPYNKYDKHMVQHILNFAALECGEQFEQWLEASPEEAFTTAKLIDSIQGVLEQIQTMLTDPNRTIMRRKKDPHNTLLNAGLNQELANMLSGLQDNANTLDQLLAKTPNITDTLLKKIYQKAVSGVISGGLSVVPTGDLLTELLGSATRATELARALHPAKLKGLTEHVGRFIASSTKGEVFNHIGERDQPYKIGKYRERQLMQFGVSAISLFVPSLAVTPLTMPIALHGILTRPDFFINSVKSSFPIDVQLAVGYEAFEIGQYIDKAITDHKVANIKKQILNSTTDEELNRFDIKDPAVVSAMLEIQKEREDRAKNAKKYDDIDLARTEDAYKKFQAIYEAKKKANLRSVDGSEVVSEGGGLPTQRIRRDAGVAVPPKTENEIVSESINNTLIESLPDMNLSNSNDVAIDQPLEWIDNYNTNHLKNNGVQPPATTGKFDWNKKVQVYEETHRVLAGETEPRTFYHYKGDVTLREWALGVHHRKGWATGLNKLIGRTDDVTDDKMLEVLATSNVQNDYINEIDQFYSRPEVKDFANFINKIRLQKAVRDYDTYSFNPVGFNAAEIREKIERGEVYTIRIDGNNVNDIVAIRTDNKDGYIFVNLTTSRVYEVRWRKEGDANEVIIFKSKKQAQEFYKYTKAAIPLDALNSLKENEVEISQNGEVKNFRFIKGKYLPPVSIPRISVTNERMSFEEQLLRNKISNLKDDVDYMIKSPGELKKDYWINVATITGSILGCFLLPAAGAFSVGLATSVGARIFSFVTSQSFSWIVTITSTVIPKLVQAATADRQDEADNYLIEAIVGLYTEGAGALVGKSINELKKFSLNKMAEILECEPKDIPARLKKKLFDEIEFRRKKFSSDVGDDSLSSGTSSSRMTSGSDEPFGTDSKYKDFKFIDDDITLPETHLKKITNKFDDDIINFVSKYGTPGSGALYNELKYRTLAWKLQQHGYHVDVGIVYVKNRDGIINKQMVLRASKPGVEDSYIYFRDKVQGGNAGVSGTEFNEKHNAKVFGIRDFSKNYTSDMEFQDEFVKVEWQKGFKPAGSPGVDSEIINTPSWAKKKIFEDLEEKTLSRSNAQGRVKVDSDTTYNSRHAVKDISLANVTDNSTSAIGNEVKKDSGNNMLPQADNSTANGTNAPVSSSHGTSLSTSVADRRFKDLSKEVNKPNASVRFSDGPKGTKAIGTSLHLIGPSASNNPNNVTIYNNSTSGFRNTSNLPVHDNTKVEEAVNEADYSTKLNYERSKNLLSKKRGDAKDRLLVDHEGKIKNKLGNNVNVSRLKSPVVIFVDTRKIPGYQEGQPLPTEIPKEAIIGISTEGDKVEGVSVYIEAVTGRKIPVNVIKIEEQITTTPEEVTPETDVNLNNKKRTVMGYFETIPGQTWQQVGEQHMRYYPGKSADEVMYMIQAANRRYYTGDYSPVAVIPDKTSLILPIDKNPVAPKTPDTTSKAQSVPKSMAATVLLTMSDILSNPTKDPMKPVPLHRLRPK